MKKDEDWQTVLAASGILISIALCIVAVLSAVVGSIFMLLWNWIAPIWWVNAPQLTLLQTCGTLFLLGIIISIFKGVFSASRA